MSRRKAVRGPEAEEIRREWGLRHPFCACCGRQDGLNTHEIIGGQGGRSFEVCNFLRLCQHPCHDLAEGLDVRGPDVRGEGEYGEEMFRTYLPKLEIGHCLTLKFINDPAEYDAARLQELRGARLPDPEPIPELYLAALRRSRPELSDRILDAQDLRIVPLPPEFRR